MDKEITRAYLMAKIRITRDLGRMPMPEEIAAEMGIDVDEIKNIEKEMERRRAGIKRSMPLTNAMQSIKEYFGDEDKYKKCFNIVLILLIIAVIMIMSLQSSLKDTREAIIYRSRAYQEALEEANDNIEESNSIIEEAQSYAWESYEEMGEALDNLHTVDTVFDPILDVY